MILQSYYYYYYEYYCAQLSQHFLRNTAQSPSPNVFSTREYKHERQVEIPLSDGRNVYCVQSWFGYLCIDALLHYMFSCARMH